MATILPLAGPTLPDFRTLLVKGDYHASAPVHLALSYISTQDAARVVLLAPSRARFAAELKRFKDNWLREHGGKGRVTAAAMKVDMLYPPTPAHLALLLALFHEPMTAGKDFLHAKTIFSSAPSLIILCEPSAYFPDTSESTVSSYLLLVSQAISAVNRLQTQSATRKTAFALFDSNLEKLRLPILRPVSSEKDPNVTIDSTTGLRREPVAPLVQGYFEWIGTVENDATNLGIDKTEHTVKFHLFRTQILAEGLQETDWQWIKRFDQEKGMTFVAHEGSSSGFQQT